MTHEGETEELRYDQLVLSVGSVSRTLPVPGPRPPRDRLQEPRRRDLAAQPRDRDAGARQLDRGPRAARAAADLRLRRRRLRRASRRWPSCRTSPPTRWSAIRAPACTACAGSWSRRPTACCPRSTGSSPTTRCAELRGRGIEVRLGTTLESVDGDSATLSTGETVADPDRRLDRGGDARTRAWRSLSLPLDERGRVDRRRAPARSQGQDGVWALGDCAAVPDRRGGHAPADGAARHPPGAPGRATTSPPPCAGLPPRRYRYSSRTAFVNLGRYKAVGPDRDASPSRGFLAWWMARSYHLSQIPGLFRKVRAVIDWTVSLPFARDTAEVGSIGHPRPLPARGVRGRGQPPPALAVVASRSPRSSSTG